MNVRHVFLCCVGLYMYDIYMERCVRYGVHTYSVYT